MYIQKAEITNIKSIEHFEINFPNPAGWHVLIGDNGSGKSTIVRALALALVGKEQVEGLRVNWDEWLNKQDKEGKILATFYKKDGFGILNSNKNTLKAIIIYREDNSVVFNDYFDINSSFDFMTAITLLKAVEKLEIEKVILQHIQFVNLSENRTLVVIVSDHNVVHNEIIKLKDEVSQEALDRASRFINTNLTGISLGEIKQRIDTLGDDYEFLEQFSFTFTGFSTAFGPYRRFEGGSSEWDEVYDNPSLTTLAAHLSVFNESVALTQPIKWLKDLNYKSLEHHQESKNTLRNIRKLINSKDFLPHKTRLISISSKGVLFQDGSNTIISVNQMSDGYRSILSLTFELIRQLIRVYGSEKVFKNIEKGEMFIDLPGVVLVDEIDAHLHPTWQTRIGQWFLKYFPNLQFIVTTHSPLVCRACEKGSIWRLAAPGSDEKSGEITGLDRERLIYGNVLDAYGTGAFGENTSISQDSNEMLNRLSELNVKSMMGLINDKENKELEELRAKFPTESAIKK